MHGRVPLAAQFPPIPPTARRASTFVALLALAGVILPTEMQIFAAGLRLSPGRISAILLFFPALIVLFQKGRHLLLCDFLAVATASWMVVAGITTGGLTALFKATGGETLDFIGGYLIARAFFFGLPALNTFVRVLKVFAIIAIIFGIADTLSGRLIVHEIIGAIVHATELPQPGYRHNLVRAASTFDHAILFGAFCAVTAAILLYWEQNVVHRILVVGLCFLGCILSFSSAAIMAFMIVVSAYIYDRLMCRYSWRWIALWIVAGVLVLLAFLLANHPLAWIITHATFDPQTGYFRFLIWDTALQYIARAPMAGYGYVQFKNVILDGSVDSIWLIYSLRFGFPMALLLLLTNFAAMLPTKSEPKYGNSESHMDRMQRAFTLALLAFIFTGLTVHFWNFTWMYWGLCIGIRASIRELSIETTRRSLRYPQRALRSTVA